jgi:hypothetical protein
VESSAVASFIAGTPVRILVLAHGFPWLDGSKSDDELAQYAQEAVDRWTAFAQAQHAIVVAPAFGGSEFGGYRALFGRSIDADAFVNALVDEVGGKYIPHFSGRFSLHGLSGSPDDGKAPDQAAGSVYTPRRPGWLTAASEVRVSVLVGSRDTEPQWPEPGQPGSTRIERATGWIGSMRRHAEISGKKSMIHFVQAQGLDHDEASMAIPAQEILAREWAAAGPRK